MERGSFERCKGNAEVSRQADEYIGLGDAGIKNNEVFKVRLNGCSNGKTGTKFNGEITIIYVNTDTGLENSATGQIRGTVN